MLRHFMFEIRKQCKSLTLLVILLLFTTFVVTQFTELPHLPITSENDITALERTGERDYVFVEASDEEILARTLTFIEMRIEEGAIPADTAYRFDPVLEVLRTDGKTFDDVYAEAQQDDYVLPWIATAKAQFQDKRGSIDEVNANLYAAVGNTGYTHIFYEKYVTYMQVIATLLIFPIFLLLFTKDYRQGMYEIVYAQPLSATKYILSRYLSGLISILLYLYLFGLLLNGFSAIQFIRAGWTYHYTPFIPQFSLYLLPTMLFLSALIMLLMQLFRKAIAVFPIYILYAIFNVTPDVFGSNRLTSILYRPVVRLDTQQWMMQEVIVNRIVYLVLSVIFIATSCWLHTRMRQDLRKAVTI